MSGNNINFDDKKLRKSTFYKKKTINNIEDIDVNNILVSKKEPYGNKNSLKDFTGYNDNDIIRPLCVKYNFEVVFLKNVFSVYFIFLRNFLIILWT